MPEADDIRYCQSLMRRHGVSYAFATRWFPVELQKATAVLYAFFRIPDDLVDAATSTDTRRQALLAWQAQWQNTQRTQTADHPVLRSAYQVFTKYHIPFAYGDAFLHAMTQDLSVTGYATYADLEKYMYGSAAVVGIIMSYVIGFKHETTLEKAKALGEAMQLTNFLRDIKEDIDERGRIYLPREDLERFSVTEEDIRAHRLTPQMIELLKFEIQRARDLYQVAESGIDELAPHGRFAVRLASRLYAAILKKIEQANYQIFQVRARTTVFEKIVMMLKLWLAKNNVR